MYSINNCRYVMRHDGITLVIVPVPCQIADDGSGLWRPTLAFQNRAMALDEMVDEGRKNIQVFAQNMFDLGERQRADGF